MPMGPDHVVGAHRSWTAAPKLARAAHRLAERAEPHPWRRALNRSPPPAPSRCRAPSCGCAGRSSPTCTGISTRTSSPPGCRPGLEPDVHDGRAYVGLIPFRMARIGVGPAGVPLPQGRFPETNVRTYVVGPDGGRGVYFHSLDVTRLAPAVVARTTYRLPYCWSRMGIGSRGDRVAYRAWRRWPGPQGAQSHVVVEVGDRSPPSERTAWTTSSPRAGRCTRRCRAVRSSGRASTTTRGRCAPPGWCTWPTTWSRPPATRRPSGPEHTSATAGTSRSGGPAAPGGLSGRVTRGSSLGGSGVRRRLGRAPAGSPRPDPRAVGVVARGRGRRRPRPPRHRTWRRARVVDRLPRRSHHTARRPDDDDRERDPVVAGQAEVALEGVDAQRLDPRPADPVADQVDEHQRPAAQRPAPVDPQQDADEREVPQRLVEERRVEGGELLVAGAAEGGLDLERPGQVGRPAVELLVEVVAPPADRLRQRQRRRRGVGHRRDRAALARV
jgi:hypothetical protein